MRKDSIGEPTQAREEKVVHMSVENSNHTAPIHLDDDAEEEVAQRSPAAEEQKADRAAVQEESPANERIQEFAMRASRSFGAKQVTRLFFGSRKGSFQQRSGLSDVIGWR
jgi:hypothetical protein